MVLERRMISFGGGGEGVYFEWMLARHDNKKNLSIMVSDGFPLTIIYVKIADCSHLASRELCFTVTKSFQVWLTAIVVLAHLLVTMFVYI